MEDGSGEETLLSWMRNEGLEAEENKVLLLVLGTLAVAKLNKSHW